jgi:hypothetical protein
MQIYKDGVIADYKVLFPQVSFSATGPSNKFLEEQGAYKVNMFIPHNRETQKLVPAEPYINNGWAYTVQVADKTAEDIAAEVDTKAAQLRRQRDIALMNSDWTQVLDAPVDRTAWATYRQALRDLPQDTNFPNVELPATPGSQVVGNIDGGVV